MISYIRDMSGNFFKMSSEGLVYCQTELLNVWRGTTSQPGTTKMPLMKMIYFQRHSDQIFNELLIIC